MDNQIKILDLFNKYKLLFEFYYEQKAFIIEDQNTDLNNYLDLSLKLKKSLDNIDFGKISYNNKLLYLFIQYLIKEIEIINNINNSDKFNVFQPHTSLNVIFSQSLITDLCCKKIFTLSYIELDTIFTKYENFSNNIDLSKYNFNIFQLKNMHSFFNSIIEVLIEINDTIGGNLTPDENELISKRIKLITKTINVYKKDLLRKLVSNRNYSISYDLKIIENILKINEYRSELEFHLETLELFKINCFDSLNALNESINPDKSIKYLYQDLNSKKLMSFVNKKKTIEFEISKIQNWLTENHFFPICEFYPIIIHKKDQGDIDWIYDPEIELIYKNNKIIGAKILLMNEIDRENKKGIPLGEWELKEWVRNKLIPGELFLCKIFPKTQKTNYLSIKNYYGQQRWNLLFKIILLKYDYYSEPEEHFLAIFRLYYDVLLVIGVLHLYEGKNFSNICKNIHDLTGIDLINCSYDLLKKQGGFSYKLIEIIDFLHLLQVEDKIVTDLLPIQRFFDILGKNLNFPFYILKQIYEKYFKIKIHEENKEKISTVFQI
ncbi:MAG: hypothetical protein HeimC3_51830 [Candidatus Heimdallarchaeota archaeon LC_3]|nr:MAG: hypothetical protein HeimC3_51830 [Candidatus Heimdallarchaeota archaeon LC_3]